MERKTKHAAIVFSGNLPFDISRIEGVINEERDQPDGSKTIFMEIPQRNPIITKPKKEDTKQDIELSRYKQDCRKKALEMAHDERIELIDASKASKGDKIEVTLIADKYYNWLISIPDK